MQKSSLAILIRWLAILAVVALLGGLASRDAGTFYAQLSRPAWAPPAGVFGPVWTVLYVLMAVAAWRVERKAAGHRGALKLFVAQLALNALWSWLFFAWHLGAAAFADILLLDALVAMTIAAFWRVDRVAASMMLPYLAWISFATALNWAVWRASPALLGA